MRRVLFTVSDKFLVELDAWLSMTGEKRSRFLCTAAKEKLERDKNGKGTIINNKSIGTKRELEQKVVVNERLDARVDAWINNQLATQDGSMQLLDELDLKTKAQLLISRMPKPKSVDEDLQSSYLGLLEALKDLPETSEVYNELSQLRKENGKLKLELENANIMLRFDISQESKKSFRDYLRILRDFIIECLADGDLDAGILLDWSSKKRLMQIHKYYSGLKETGIEKEIDF